MMGDDTLPTLSRETCHCDECYHSPVAALPFLASDSPLAAETQRFSKTNQARVRHCEEKLSLSRTAVAFVRVCTTRRQSNRNGLPCIPVRNASSMESTAPPPSNATAAAAEVSEAEVLAGYMKVKRQVQEACERRDGSRTRCTLVAVSKTKPFNLLQHLYDAAGVRIFGENYAQELVEKASAMPQNDIEWHFIGHLQSNKAAMLVRDVAALHVVETVDSESLAKKLDAAVSQYRADRRLRVFLQVNTSGEESKSGLPPGDAVKHLAQYIAHDCPHLILAGVMTIGSPDYLCTVHDFHELLRARADVSAVLECEPESLELSMGMSNDFVDAIAAGSTNVRVGSSIFGARNYGKK